MAVCIPCRRYPGLGCALLKSDSCFTSDFPVIKRQSVSTMRRKTKYQPGDFYFQSVFSASFYVLCYGSKCHLKSEL